MPEKSADKNKTVLCACGCGSSFFLYDKWGRERIFLKGHNKIIKDFKEYLLLNILKNKETGCWEWVGTKTAAGYGVTSYRQKKIYAHRLSYENFIGPIEGDLFVCHRCDNPCCINPEHLFLGNACENVHDAHKKGRIKGKSISSLNVMAIRKLIKSGYSQTFIAQVFKVDKSYISRVVNYKRRSNVTGVYI